LIRHLADRLGVSSQFDVVASSGSNAYVFNEKAAASKSSQKMVAVVNEVSGPYFVVLARKDANPPAATATLKEKLTWLSKQRVGVSARGAETENIVRGIMLTNDVDPKSATWIAAGDPTSSLSAWTGGRLDAIVSWQPAQQRIADTGTAVALVDFLELRKTDPLFDKGWSTNTWWTSTAFAEKSPDKLEKFANSIDGAVKFINDPANKDSIVEMFAKKYNLDTAIVAKAFTAWDGVFTSELTCKAFDNAQGFYKSVGIINQAQSCSDLSWKGSKYISGLK
jgi:ABC-type nitrate/sulfonate/bicarbonate transport system substrate-binding protein